MDVTKEKEECTDPAEYSYKKSKMRTASDVISRLLWDETLPKDYFMVGYLDRFKGLMEKPFVTLDWSDPATVDNFTLALPKHRIQYFKYKNRRAWDKTTRTDFIFGSTGQTINIYDFMKQVDEEEFNFFDECYLNNENDDEDVQPLSSIPKKSYDVSDRPNYFVAARITNEDVVKKLSDVSESVKEKNPVLNECCIGSCLYHITLCILKLDSVQEIKDVASVLKNLKDLQLDMPVIELDKLNVFKHRVLYACIKPNKEFDKLRRNLIKLLQERNINITDRFTFVPHVTIVKLSRPVQRALHSEYLDPSLYIAHQEENFGTQSVTKLNLCEMKEIRREDGFYLCAAEVDVF